MTQQTKPTTADKRSARRWTYEDYETGSTGKRRRSSSGVVGIIAIVLVIVAIIVLAAFGIYRLAQSLEDIDLPLPEISSSEDSSEPTETTPAEDESKTAPAEPLTITDKPRDEDSEELTTVEIVERVRPSVVGVLVYTSDDTLTPSATGSGIIMSENGYIITNSHVVADAVSIGIELDNGDTYTARKVGADSKTDLALLYIEAEGLTAAEFGNSDELRVGERVVAIGNPAGTSLAGSTTQGIISGINRSIGSGSYKTTYLQTDAAINPGNSGGALINVYGQVIGINSSKIAGVDYEGIGFAIPINEAKPIIDALMEYGYVKDRTKIGFSGQEITEALAEINGLPTGIYVWSIEDDSSLATQDVRRGDVVTHLDGQRIETFAEVGTILEQHKPGDTITMTIYRPADGKGTDESTFDVSVTLLEDRGD